MTDNPMFAIGLGLLGYALLNTGMGTQKHSAEVWFAGQQMFASKANRQKMLVWFFGLFQVAIACSLLPVAISYSNISTISPLSGFGIVVLALFSHFVLGERLTRSDLLAVGIVMAGTLWLGLHLHQPRQQLPDEPLLWSVIGGSFVLIVVCGWYSARNQWKWAGPIFAVSGALVATFTLFFPSLFASAIKTFEQDTSAGLMALLTNLYAYLYVIFNLIAMVPLQIAYRHGRAIEVIPIYSSLFMTLPIFGGIILFQEQLSYHQWLGIGVILVGILLLTLVGDRHKPTS